MTHSTEENAEASATWITRREVLAQAALGAVAAAVSPYIGGAQALVTNASPAPRSRESFDFGWKFLQATPRARRCRTSPTQAGAKSICRTTGASKARSIRQRPAAVPGGYLPTGIGWYRKHFRMPAADRGRRSLLEFDGVYQNSEVWINGQFLGLRPYGYVPFAYELTPYLKFGRRKCRRREGGQLAPDRIAAGTPARAFIGTSGCCKTNPLHVAHWGTLRDHAPRHRASSATVEMKTRVANDRKSAAAAAR